MLQVIMTVHLEISCSWHDSIISEPAGGAALAEEMHHFLFSARARAHKPNCNQVKEAHLSRSGSTGPWHKVGTWKRQNAVAAFWICG